MAKADGATKIIFDIRGIRGDKWRPAKSLVRFHTILFPGPALAGLPVEVFSNENMSATKAKQMPHPPGGEELTAFCKSGRTFERLRTVLELGAVKYTVTLRNTERDPGRNSDRQVWLDFAAAIGAIVINDYEETPIHLHDRIALYASAQMNFFTQNGPGALCSFTNYPMMMFDAVKSASTYNRMGIEYGAQPPWHLSNQRMVWELATPESLHRHFEHWYSTGQFAVDRLPKEI